MNLLNKKYLIIISSFFIVIIISSCREEVISPNNPVGNVNEPIKERRSNFYSFSIYANNITNEVTDNTFIETNSSNVFFSLIDYASGSVEVSIYNLDDIIFRKSASENLPDFTTDIRGVRPNFIQIKFINFSGKFKVQVSGSQ